MNPKMDGQKPAQRCVNANPGETPPSPEGPLVAPGVYTVTLTVDGKRYVQTVNVKMDPRSTASAADLRAQHELQMKLYRCGRESWDAYQKIAELRASVSAITKANPPEAVSKAAGASGKGAESGSAWYINNTFTSNAGFVSAYKNKYNADPDQFAAQGYAAIYILADAAKRAKLTFSDVPGDRTRLRDAMESVNIQTPLGPFQFTSTHDVKQTIWVIQMDGSGGFTLVQSVKPS